jgi:hypothetical protein
MTINGIAELSTNEISELVVKRRDRVKQKKEIFRLRTTLPKMT